MNRARWSAPGIYLGLGLMTLVMALPFLWMLSTSLKQNQYLLMLPPRFFPNPASFNSYIRLFTIYPMGRMFFNSILVTGIAVLAQVLTSAMAGYAFARIPFKGKTPVFFLYLMTLMVPYQVTITPLFILMTRLGLVNTYPGLILPVFTSAFGVFLLRQTFLSLPAELEESAVMDGAGHPRIFGRISLPLVKPALATLTVVSLMSVWNAFLWPLIITRDREMMTLPVGLATLQGEYQTQWNLVMAGAVITVLPIIAAFLIAQKHFIQGMSRSGIKN